MSEIDMVFGVFRKKLDKLARESGFIKRKGKLKARDFLILMSFGQLGSRFPSLSSMVDSIKLKISREALHQRFNNGAVEFLKHCLNHALSEKLGKTINPKIFKPFKRIVICDSSSWDIRSGLSKLFKGCGGSGSKANCKLQLAYELKEGRFQFLEPVSGKLSDVEYSTKLPRKLEENDLLIADLGYFNTKMFRKLSEQGSYFLFRLIANRKTFDPKTLEEIDLRAVLKRVRGNYHECEVVLGSSSEKRIVCRLICLRVSRKIAEERRRQHKYTGKYKRNCVPSKKKLDLCNWTLLITNIPKNQLPTEKVYPSYRLRWQIELIIKQFKSVLQIHKGATANEHRFLCELYGKLIVAVLVHNTHSCLSNQVWEESREELSFDKFWKRIQERSFVLTVLLKQNLKKATRFLSREIKYLLRNCLKFKQSSRESSLDYLLSKQDLLPICQSLT